MIFAYEVRGEPPLKLQMLPPSVEVLLLIIQSDIEIDDIPLKVFPIKDEPETSLYIVPPEYLDEFLNK